ncbi:MAG: M3 family oligoendopeptidase [Actinomycetota bacterium]
MGPETVVEPSLRAELPHWDMTPVFASLTSAELESAFGAVITQVRDLSEMFDRHDVRGGREVEIDDKIVAVAEEIIEGTNRVGEDLRTLGAYIRSFVATDSRNTVAQGRLTELEAETVDLSRLDKRFKAWLASLDVEELIRRSQVAGDHAFALQRNAEAAEHQMTEPEESLFAGLHLTGGSAWSRLYGNVTSLLVVEFERPGGTPEKLPISRLRAMAQDADPEVRRAAYDAEMRGFESVSVPIAAALNSIKGELNTVSKLRGWEDALEPALFSNNIDRATLEAMQSAVTESFPDFRRYLRAKAQFLGRHALPWWDLFAPLSPEGAGEKDWDWPSATDFINQQFATYSARLAGLSQRSFDEGWVDAEPREGKRDGAFCMGVRGDESRVLMNFSGSFNSVQTLAHELGHAYHNLNLSHRTPMQRLTPMALAETASIFCQNLVVRAAIEQASQEEKLLILEGDLQSVCQVVVDIHSRFLFESAVFEKRQRRELSVEEFCDLMLWSQRETYGDGLDGEALHPYMWAAKPHYYAWSFYNFPYTFGLLFGLGLYARYEADPDGFRAGYDELLSSTGMGTAADLASRFDIDVRSVDFWRSSLDVIRGRISEFESLI